MPSLRKLKGKFYARVYNVYNPEKRCLTGEKLIPLNTTLQRDAIPRKHEVERMEEAIRNGERVQFFWQSELPVSIVNPMTLNEIIPKYLKTRKADGLRLKTIKSYEISLYHFSQAVGGKTPIEKITSDSIVILKEYLNQNQWGINVNRNFSIISRNIYLRSVKVFLKWVVEKGYLDSAPEINPLRQPKQNPVYVSNEEFNSILCAVESMNFRDKADSEHFKRAFEFYRQTGCRLSEPFHSFIDGRFMIIEAETSKTHTEREIYLTPELIRYYYELQDRFHHRKQKSESTFVEHYSDVFRKACNKAEIKGKKFHSLRHTYAVRRYLETRDLYQVAKELGHSSIKTTEKYASFSFRRLEQAFPDLSKGYLNKAENSLEMVKKTHPDTDSPDTGLLKIAVS